MPPNAQEISEWVDELLGLLPVFEASPWVQLEMFGDERRPQPPAEAG